MARNFTVIFVSFSIIGVSLFLASCSTTTTEEPNADTRRQFSPSRLISPVENNLIDPSVITNKNAQEYYEDLEYCHRHVENTLGLASGTDNVAAIKRALQNGIAGNSLDVGFNATDPTVKRGYAVKRCMSGKGYLVR